VPERKPHPRRRTLKPAKIVFDRRNCVIDCMVRNVSAAGACLELPSTVGVPDRFDLMVATETYPRHCRVAWKDDTRVGVTFTA
jgi:PilZ domain